jgi:hypothetical protein
MAMKPTTTEEISVLEISEGMVTFCVIGNSPLIFNRMAEKAKRELLMPKGRKSTADRAASLKHHPTEEYRNSVYRNVGEAPKTRLKLPAPAFKGAMATAALDLPGTKKSEIGRLVWVQGEYVDVYGVPKLLMSVVRSADINKTPDIRTRAIVAEWACSVTIRFVKPKLQAKAIGNLMAAAGITAGVGDFRQEKGKGSFGQFRLVDATDPDFLRIISEGGRDAQDAGLEACEPYDWDTEELLDWFTKELARRDDDKAPANDTATRKRKAA